VRRGEIVTVDLDPARGSGSGQTRPAVIVSNDTANSTADRHAAGIQVNCPRHS
jgi:mRNA interferase MazF